MRDLFASEGPNLDQIYLLLKTPESENRKDVRDYVDALWQMYEPYAEPDFVREFALHVMQRYWEMYLASVCLDMGFSLEPNRGTAARPDIKITHQGCTIWIEAVAPTAGALGKPDTVPRARLLSEMVEAGEEPVAQKVPIDKILLRCANAVNQKKRASDKYFRDGIIKKSDVNLIAVSGAEAMNWRPGDGKRYALGCVLGVGPQYVALSPGDGKIVDSGFMYRDVVNKTGGSSVITDCFFQEGYRDISGLIFCGTSIGNSPQKLGADLITIHNPRANQPLPRGTLNRGIECWVREEPGRFFIDESDYERER